jgi:hypothetical protein
MKYFFFGLLFFLFTLSATSQYQNVMISNVFSPNEPSIIMDINQQDLLFVGASLNSYFISVDTGLTWTQAQLISDLGVYGDPVVVVDSESKFYYLHLSNPYEFYPDGDTLDRIVCQRSLNNGASWSNGSFFGLDPSKDNTRESAVVDYVTDNIYATWTQFDSYGSTNPLDSSHILFVKSDDAGLTWSEPIRLDQYGGNSADSDSTLKGAVPAIGANGEIYVSWAGPNGIVFDKSLDEGASWLNEDVLVDSMPGGWDFNVPGLDRCNGLPVTKCDISGGPYNGTIYINWSDQRNGEEDTDIWVSKSTDGGETWSEAIRVNDDQPGKHQFLSWMDVDQTNGHIYTIFYDRRNQEGNNTDVYLARSTDGGENFTNILISDTSFLPSDSIVFGDYNGLVAYDGIIRPVWSRMENGEQSIWTALIDFSIWNGIEEEGNTISAFNCFPNPVKDRLTLTFQLKKEATLGIDLIDSSGRSIKIKEAEVYLQGDQSLTIDLSEYDLKSGLFFIAIQMDNKRFTQKVMLE